MAEYRKLTPFGKKVKKRLIDMDMTQVKLAEMLGIKKQYITKIICGEMKSSKYIEEISKILDINEVA